MEPGVSHMPSKHWQVHFWVTKGGLNEQFLLHYSVWHSEKAMHLSTCLVFYLSILKGWLGVFYSVFHATHEVTCHF